MRTRLVVFVLLVAFAALALLVSTAAAASGPRGPVPAVPVVPKTVAMLPGSAYPWVQPVWRRSHGIVHVTLPLTIQAGDTQPPAWVFTH